MAKHAIVSNIRGATPNSGPSIFVAPVATGYRSITPPASRPM